MLQAATIAICVGATKSGTSWLHTQLAAHPDCHFRTIKELHYFDTVASGRNKAQIREHQAEKQRLKGRLPVTPPEQLARLRRRIADLRDWVKVLAEPRIDLPAYADYLLSGRESRAVVGEVTPAYATLPIEVLRQMAGMAPDVRIIYLMRDPVARMWSHVRMLAWRATLSSAQFDGQVAQTFDEFAAHDPVMQQRGDYAAALAKLMDAVAPERLLVMFSEEMMTPVGMQRLWSFLGIAPGKVDLHRKVHEGTPLAMSMDQRRRARTALLPQYRAVARHFPALPDAWQKSMEEVAA